LGTGLSTSPAMAVVRWAWVVLLSMLTLVGVALAPATGLLTLPFALTTCGLAVWLARGGPGRPTRAALWLVGIGMVGMIVLFVLALVV
jgi:hypothetical protein